MRTLPLLAVALAAPSSAAFPQGLDLQLELAGVSLPEYPHFTNVRAFNEGAPVEIAIDTLRSPRFARRTVDVYVGPHRDPGEWSFGAEIAPWALRAPISPTLEPGGIANNVFVLDAGTLNGTTGTTEVGIGYDVVLDFDRNGVLDAADAIDGWGSEAGFYVMPDLTLDGPYATVEAFYRGGLWRRQDIYYPANVATLGELPLVVVSHGNGHDYRWYDHIGYFLASWGYVVMSHSNNTGPGIERASATTLVNTQHFLLNLDRIAGGVLEGHVDSHRMVWIGHSRGGEGVVRAYRRLVEGDPLVNRYTADDVILVSSIAPTDFLGPVRSNPGDVTYHLWTGGADADVNGCANCDICQTFHLHERATGRRLSISLHGVGHGDFHDGGGSSVANGPCRVRRPRTHRIMRGYLLPLVKHVVEGNVPCKDYLWRQWESLHPIGAPTSPCVVVDLMYQDGPGPSRFVLDDFQTNFEPEISSSGGRVVYSVANLTEDRLDDGDRFFTHAALDAMNGMTMAGPGDSSRGIVFEWSGTDESLLFEVPAGRGDLSGFTHLAFRAAQATRHPFTRSESGDLTFGVQLIDARGRQRTIHVGAYGGGVEEPYQRAGCGIGRGWANEWETIRIPLRDFTREAPDLDLRRIAAVGFLFGPSHGSFEGRIGLDEIELSVD